MDGKGTTWRRNIAENFNRLSRVHKRYRQTDRRQTDRRQTDGRPMTYSEHELEFTFANDKLKLKEMKPKRSKINQFCAILPILLTFKLMLQWPIRQKHIHSQSKICARDGSLQTETPFSTADRRTNVLHNLWRSIITQAIHSLYLIK